MDESTNGPVNNEAAANPLAALANGKGGCNAASGCGAKKGR